MLPAMFFASQSTTQKDIILAETLGLGVILSFLAGIGLQMLLQDK